MRVLDLFCGAGGAAVGYGSVLPVTEIVGIDIKPQPDYPYTFIQADIFDLDNPFDLWPIDLGHFDLIHASPPCQAYSTLRHSPGGGEYPDLIGQTRALLRNMGNPYVIENVPGAPLVNPLRLCGSMFDLRYDGFELRRHRLFEIAGFGVGHFPPQLECQHRDPVLGVYGDLSKNRRPSNRGVKAGIFDAECLMGIRWMSNPKDLVQAIPPAYTAYIAQYHPWMRLKPAA